MNPRLEPVGHLVALVGGALLAFFFAWAPLFTDGADLGERLFSVGLTLAFYLLFSMGLGYAWPHRARIWAGEVATPALLILAWYTTKEPQAAGLHLIYAGLAVGGAFLGVFLGARLARARAARA